MGFVIAFATIVLVIIHLRVGLSLLAGLLHAGVLLVYEVIIGFFLFAVAIDASGQKTPTSGFHAAGIVGLAASAIVAFLRKRGGDKKMNESGPKQ